jgi:probable phosphoglycerate mutase
MPIIYVLRHGQTDWNAERRFQGQIDIPLNGTGRAQAARNGRLLAQMLTDPASFDYTSSPLSRASETMEIVRRELGLDPLAYRTDARLKEIHVGDWQGLLTREIFGARADGNAGKGSDRWNFIHPGAGGESYAILSARTLDWLTGIERDTVAVAHGGVLRCLQRHLLGLDEEETFKLNVPQDKLLRIEDGVLAWV